MVSPFRDRSRENDNPVSLTLRPNEVVTERLLRASEQLEKEKEEKKDALLKAIGEFLKVEPSESDGAIMAALQRGLQIQDEVALPQVPTPSLEDYLRLQQKVAEQEATIKDLRDVVDKMCRQQPAEPRGHSTVSAEKSGGERRIDAQPIQAVSIKREVEESEHEIAAHPSVENVPTATAGELPTKRRRNTLDVQTVEERKAPRTPRGAGDDIKSQIVLQSIFVAATPRPTTGGSLDWLADAYATPRTPQNQTQSETIEDDDFHSRVGKLSLKQREQIVKKIAGFRVHNGQSGYSALDLTDLSLHQLNSVQSRLFTPLDEVNFNADVRKLAEPSRKHIAAMINSFHNQNRQTWKPKLTENSAMDVCDLSRKQWVKVRNRLHELIGFEKEMMEKQPGKSMETREKFPEKAMKNSSVSLDETSATYDESCVRFQELAPRSLNAR